MSFVVRDGLESDHPFVYGAWLKAYEASPDVRGVERVRYFAAQHDRIERLLERSKLTVAVDEADAFILYGFALVEDRDVLHWVAVKREFRRLGIARALLEPFTITRYSHRSRLCFANTSPEGKRLDPIAIPAGWRFDPYALENMP